MAKDKTQNTNLASEFYVASQLFRLGFTVTITLGHTKEIDLIVAHPDGRTVTVDVKGLKDTTNWPLTPKLRRKNHFYALVAYRGKFSNIASQPEIFIIPSVGIEKLLVPWSGKPEVTCIVYSKIRGSKYKDAWMLLFK